MKCRPLNPLSCSAAIAPAPAVLASSFYPTLPAPAFATEPLGITRVTVATWRKRFAMRRLDGLADAPRPGASRKIGDDQITEVVTTTLETMPRAATPWSTRSMARASGLSVSTVQAEHASALEPNILAAYCRTLATQRRVLFQPRVGDVPLARIGALR